MIATILAVLFIHYVADFICQTRWMAENKSKDITALLYHMYSYTGALGIGLAAYSYFHEMNILPVLGFIIVNVSVHFCVDYTTSKLNTYFFNQKKLAFFWWSIGFDQYIHTGLLILTVPWLLR
jgi:Protein of unknown function (DUF3307)